MFEFVPLVGTMFGTKCPTFGTKLHEECTKKAECFFVRVVLKMKVKTFSWCYSDLAEAVQTDI